MAGDRGVFQQLTARGRGGPIHGVVWDDAGCVCASGCPSIQTINGTDGHGRGGVLSVADDGVTILSGGFGYISSSAIVGLPSMCTGRVITARVLIQPFDEDFDIETSGLELVNITSFTSRYESRHFLASLLERSSDVAICRYGGGHKYRTTATRTTMSTMIYLLVVVFVYLNFLAVVFHVVMIVYRSKLERRILTKLKQA